MKRSTVLVFLFGLFLERCGSSRQNGEKAEVVRHNECLLRALATDDSYLWRYFHLLHLDIHFFLLLCHFDFEYIFLLLSNLHKLMFYILLIYNWDGFSISLLLSFVLHKGRYNNLRHLYNEIQPVVWNSN